MTTTDVAIRHDDLGEKVEWAKTLAVANLLPKAFQNNPGNLLFAVEYADALGISRINAITSIHVIEGKPSASADLIAALVRRAGHILRVQGDDTHALAELIRADDETFTYSAEWTLDKAKAAGLTGKGVWKNYPAAMLRSRAITEVARMGASEALLGLIYTPEELGADVDQTGAPVRVAATVQPTSGADRMRAIVSPQTITNSEPTEAEWLEVRDLGDAPEAITPEQVTKIHVLLGKVGMAGMKGVDPEANRTRKLRAYAVITGREVSSTKDLTKAEASKIIDSLEAKEQAQPEPDWDDADLTGSLPVDVS